MRVAGVGALAAAIRAEVRGEREDVPREAGGDVAHGAGVAAFAAARRVSSSAIVLVSLAQVFMGQLDTKCSGHVKRRLERDIPFPCLTACTGALRLHLLRGGQASNRRGRVT